MAKKPEPIVRLAAQTARQIFANSGNYMAFLTTAAHNYKYSFRDQLLIYAQKPDATACAQTDFWNKHGRWVNKGTTGIALLVDTDKGYKLRHVFDMSDTNSRVRRTVPVWQMRSQYEGPVVEALENSYGEFSDKSDLAACLLETAKVIVEDNFGDYYADLCRIKEGSLLEELDDLNTEVWFKGLLENSVAYIMLTRCGIDPQEYFSGEDFARIYDFNTLKTLAILGAAASDIAEMPLREIASTVLPLYWEEEKQNRTFAGNPDRQYNDGRTKRERSVEHGADIQNRGRLSTAQPGRAGGPAGRKIWDAAAQFPRQSPARDLHRDAVDRGTEQPSGGNRPAGHRDGGAADGANGAGTGRDREPESIRSDEMGGPDEQHQGSGGGSGAGGDRVRQLTDPLPTEEEQKAAIQAAEDEQSSAFAISQEDIDAILLHGSGIADGKFRIFEQFQTAHSSTENTSFLKEEYKSTTYFTVATDKKIRAWFDRSGVKISIGDLSKPEAEIRLTWKKAAKRIGQLVEAGRYLSPAEKEKYQEYQRQESVPGPLAAAPEPEHDELNQPPAPPKEYRLTLGATVYLGTQGYELLAFDGQTVRLFDPAFPIINKELPREEFDRLLAENPLNNSLLQVVEEAASAAEPAEPDTPGYDLGFGHLGNGVTVWNSLELEDGDYKIIAHISPDRTVKFYVDNLPGDVRARIEQFAATSTMTISATQDAPVFSTPPLVREPAVAPAEAGEPTYPPRELPYIFCEWSENTVFQDKTAYSLSEFDRLMKQTDDEYVAKKAAAMAKYGTWQKWYDADDPEYNAFLSYDKVKFTLVMPDGRTFTERQDIGDGDGGVLDFLSQYDAYREIVPILQEAVRKEVEAAQSGPTPQPGPDSGRFWDAYNSIKERSPDSLLLYQVGDFFELYGGVEGDDAWNAATALDLTLTKRNIPEYGRVSMCGFPVHKLEDYVKRLTGKGFSVVVAALKDNQRVISSFPAQPREKTKQETDDFSDVDPAAVRAALAENGIVDGHVVDADKLAADPFIQQVMADVEQIAADTPPAQEPAEQEEKPLPPPAPRRRAKVSPFVLHPEIPNAGRHEYHITDDAIGVGTPGTRFNNNIRAIRLLKKLEREERFATPEEQAVLAQYVGWGGLADCFDERHSKYAELKALLDEDEYAAARESTLTAFYTPPVVIRSIYQALENMGFKTGNLLEPSCGIGNFIGMHPDDLADSKIYGIELDGISGRIAQQLYQKSSIAVQGFETTELPDSFFDAAIGNVPFGAFKVSDKRYDKHNFLIHDYFFARTLDKVRPGGIIAFVTSKGTMDKENPNVRKYIAQRADLLGAIRLPNNTFKAAAGTEVTSDILFLQKREALASGEPDWVHLNTDENGLKMNQYFINHPEMVMGEMREVSGPHGPETACLPRKGQDLGEQLTAAIQNIQGTITEYVMDDPEAEGEDKAIPADPNVRNFSYTVVDGEIYYRENSRMNPVEVSVTAANRIKGLIEIRDCVRTLIEYQTEDWPAEDIQAQQKKLNTLYDAYVEKYGRINSRGNSIAFRMDSAYFLLASLEVLDDERNFVRKADMFTKRTIKQKTVVTSVDTASEALAVSLAERACVDLGFMASLMGGGDKIPQVVEDLKGVIFKDPNTGPFDIEDGGTDWYKGWQTADEYLSGNVREKLADAKRAAETDPAFQVNVEALEQVQPTDLNASEISVRLGSTWLPPDVVEQFVFELLDTSANCQEKIHIHFSQYTGAWNVEGKSVDRVNVKANSTYGTTRINAYKIIEDTLNLRDVRIFDYVQDRDGKRVAVLNKKETAIAQGKQELIKQAFQDWIWKDPARRERLTTLYNVQFNSLRPREYDGSHISFVGMNPEITLRKHQRDAIARILYGGNYPVGPCGGGRENVGNGSGGAGEQAAGPVSKEPVRGAQPPDGAVGGGVFAALSLREYPCGYQKGL